MTKEFTIPEILGLMHIRGYSPRLGSAINTLLNTSSGIEYDQALKVATQEITGYDNVEVHDPLGKGDATNWMGLPIYHPLILEGIPGTEASEDLVIDGAIIEFNRAKDIVITKIQGQEKSVKEHINDGDYNISVSGILCNVGPGYPMEQVLQYKAFMDLNQPISIVHEVLNAFDINEIVITDHTQPKGPFTNAQSFQFNALDDKPILI